MAEQKVNTEAKEDKGPNLEKIEKGFDVMSTMRQYVDAIPEPKGEGPFGNLSMLGMVKDTLNAGLTLLESPRTGILKDNPEVGFQAVMDLGPGMMSVASRGPAGALGMFGSRPGKYARPEIQDRYIKFRKKAEEMEAKGEFPEDIWNLTGMSRDHKNQWVYEISDGQNTKVRWEKFDMLEDDIPMTLEDVIDSPNVFDHWPELKSIPVRKTNSEEELGAFDIINQTIYLNPKKLSLHPASDIVRRVILHESQHALQNLQGRPGGTSADFAHEQMTKAVDAANRLVDRARKNGGLSPEQDAALHKITRVKKLWQDMQEDLGDMAAYWADPGEVEARLTEVSPETGAMFPGRQRPGSTAFPPEQQFSPDDIQFPDRAPLAAGGKTFGKRPPSQYEPLPEGDELPVDEILQAYARNEKTAREVQRDLRALGYKAHLRNKSSLIELEDLRTGEFKEYQF